MLNGFTLAHNEDKTKRLSRRGVGKVDEFELIDFWFRRAEPKPGPDLVLGIGDDASVHRCRPGMELVVSTDMSVAGVHWPADYPLQDAAKKALAAALSDLAAMGAEAACVWCALGAPDAEAVRAFAKGLREGLVAHDVPLAGGDLSRARELTVAFTVAGWVPEGKAMRRDAAQVGETVWIAGPVGLASIGLAQWLAGRREGGFLRFLTPQARLAEGVRLRELGVRCCIDVSDGLVADAEKIAQASGVGLELDLDATPAWETLVAKVGLARAVQAVAAGGEDFALLFTAPSDKRFLETIAAPIGRVVDGQGVRARVAGEEVQLETRGFVHFR